MAKGCKSSDNAQVQRTAKIAMTTHGNRSQIAADKLRQMIITGELRLGQHIAEREISAHLDGISRTPLRDALKILASEGLLTIAPNRGATVTVMTMAAVEHVYELLGCLEGIAAELVCQRITDQEIEQIEALHSLMYDAYRNEDLIKYFELNQAIHQLIIDAAQNPVFSRIYATEFTRIRRFRYAGNNRHERWDRAIVEHERILESLKDRNGPLLREVMRAHHQKGWQVTRDLIERELANMACSQTATSAPRGRRPAEGQCADV